MRAVVQRAVDGQVRVAGEVVGGFRGPGLVVLVGVTHTDTPADAARLADKVVDLRIFDGPTEQSAADLGLPVLVVSQFTLYGQTRKGRRPTWDQAAPGEVAEPLVGAVVARLRERGIAVSTGAFGADMRVELVNDGPMTVIIDVPDS
jgi:D-tyrosyl-tRNA(Tyr) deacylase